MKYCVFDLDGTLTYTESEVKINNNNNLPPYLTLTDSVYFSVIDDKVEFLRLMQEWRKISENEQDKIALAKIYNEKIIGIIPKEYQNDKAFYNAAYEVTKNFIKSGIIIQPAIQFLTYKLNQHDFCIISTASFEPAAKGFINALIDENLIPKHLGKNILYCGTQINWDKLTIKCYNTGETKLTTLLDCIGCEITSLSQELNMVIGDEPFAGDKAILSLNSLCFARRKKLISNENELINNSKLPGNCVWTTWENLLVRANDIIAYHKEQRLDYSITINTIPSPEKSLRFFPNPIGKKVMKHVLTLWNYHQMHHEVNTKVDCIIGLGSYDLDVVDRCVELYFQNIAKKILFSGKFGNWTKDLWSKTEAETFADRAIELGVPDKDILIEKESTNIGKNIELSRAILQEKSIDSKAIVLITKPNTERRAYATCSKIWPTINVTVSSHKKNLEQLSLGQLTALINEMVGDLQRIMLYPDMGYQIHQEIPIVVMDAYDYLIEKGYTQHMITVPEKNLEYLDN